MKVAVLGLSDPFAKTLHGGSMRTRALIDAFKKMDYEVYVYHPVAPSPIDINDVEAGRTHQVKTGLKRSLSRLKRRLLPMPTRLGGRDAAIVKGLQQDGPFDLVVVGALSQSAMASRLSVPLWVDFMDVWSEFAKIESGQRKGIYKLTSLLQASHLKKLEKRISDRAAIVTVAGWSDRESLNARGIISTYLPTPIREVVLDESTLGQSSGLPNTIRAGFLANFEYWPNVDAHALLTSVWADCLTKARIEVFVAGIGAVDLPEIAGVTNWGQIGDLRDFYANIDVTLAPIRLGGGVKTKILESLQHGLTVIASHEASEGLPPEVLAQIVIVDIDNPVFTRSGLEAAARRASERRNLDRFQTKYLDDMLSVVLSGANLAPNPD